MTILVLEEFDIKNRSTFIGVASSYEKSKEMINQYYGDYKKIKEVDHREDGIEYILYIKSSGHNYTVVVRDCQIDEI